MEAIGLSITKSSSTADELSVVVSGELDLATAPQIHPLAERVPFGGVLRIDAADLTFVDSQGLRALLKLHAAAASRQASVIIEQPGPQLRQLLELTRLSGLFGLSELDPA